MNILAIETSCDETAISIVSFEENGASPKVTVLGHALFSQIDIHKPYGGVYPNLAKRAHAANLVPILLEALTQANMLGGTTELSPLQEEELTHLFEREAGLDESLMTALKTQGKPSIDAIAVTNGPGLEPALWVGINFAKALSRVWNLPLFPTNHMEGHIASVLAEPEFGESGFAFPALALLISGGHTDLVYLTGWAQYKLVGHTIDDAVGEAYDKTARMLGLPYPGGPEIKKIADEHRAQFPTYTEVFNLPRPMLQHDNLDFSFAGLKTAVLYRIKNGLVEDDGAKHALAREFEQAVADTLVGKVKKALKEYPASYLIVAGGVAANMYLREQLISRLKEDNVTVVFPPRELSTDNATMIAIASYLRIRDGRDGADPTIISAEGNVTL